MPYTTKKTEKQFSPFTLGLEWSFFFVGAVVNTSFISDKAPHPISIRHFGRMADIF